MLSHSILEHKNLDNGFELIKYNLEPDLEVCYNTGTDYIEKLLEFDDKQFYYNMSVDIASAIATYSRMYMNKFKHLPNNPCFYTDTDSLVLQYPMSEELIGKELGQFSNDYKNIKLGIFLDPKVYYMLLSEFVNYMVPRRGQHRGGNEVKKAKGMGQGLPKSFYWELYNSRAINLYKEKWMKEWTKDKIKLLTSNIILSHTMKKRISVFKNNKWVN